MPTLDNFSLGNYSLAGRVVSPMKYATGEISSPNVSSTFDHIGSGTFNAYAVLITGLSFRPTRIILRNKSFNNRGMVVYNKDTLGSRPTADGGNYNVGSYLPNNTDNGYIFRVYEINGSSFNRQGQVTDSGFRLPVSGPGEIYVWEAWAIT